ncbi:MAG: hypothetical protein M3Y58_22415 [Chloroflexota bacterium]|nr:hypothetical protein [Chloroflexota bacterium]
MRLRGQGYNSADDEAWIEGETGIRLIPKRREKMEPNTLAETFTLQRYRGIAGALDDAERLIFVGLGTHAVKARHCAMMAAEWAKRAVLALSVDAFRHGFVEIVRPGDGIVVFDSPGAGAASARARERTGWLRRSGAGRRAGGDVHTGECTAWVLANQQGYNASLARTHADGECHGDHRWDGSTVRRSNRA